MAALAVTAYSLDRQDQDRDPASEIRMSAPEPTAKRAEASIPDRHSVPVPAPAIAEPATPAQAAEPGPPAAAVPVPRAVAPSIIAIPPVDPGSLERVEPRPPLSTIAPAAPPKPPPPKPLLFKPVAEAAGVIVADGRRIRISDVDVVADSEACARPEGGEWPCGRAARTAFRSFLRGRAVTCDFPEGEVPDDLSTTCRVGPHDIGAWLVENGWARAAGEKYEDLAKTARHAGRGVYGKGPAALPPDPGLSADGPEAGSSQGSPSFEDISILPRETDTAPAEGETGSLPGASPAGSADTSPGVSPLPPPSSPLR